MKVLHVSSYYITSKLYKNLVENLEEIGICNDVYIPVSSNDHINKYSGENNDRTKYIYSKCFNYIDRISFRYKNKKIYKDILKQIDFDSIDISHAHSLFVNGYISYKLKKDKNIDYIVAVRSTDVNTFFKNVVHLRKLGIEILKNAKQIIFISPRYKKYVIDTYIPESIKDEIDKKSIVIPNGIDDFWFDNLNLQKKVIKKDNLRLIYVGRLTKIKNIETSMKVVKRLSELGYNVNLDIVGSGEQLDYITDLLNKEYKGLVTLHGFMNREELIHLYQKNDIFIMPSKYETFGLVYVEAISQGLPVIYTRNQGFDGYFEEGIVGYPVKYNDTEEIVQKIIKMLDKSIWDFSLLEEELKSSFVWKHIAEKYKEIYNLER